MNKSESTPWMTASQFARHRCVSRQYVARLIRSGLLPMRGNLINAPEADRMLDDRPGAGQTAANGQAERYAEAKLVREVFRAKVLRLRFETERGRMIEREQVQQRIDEHVRVLRDGFARFVDSIAPAIAQESDPKRIHALLATEIRGELIRLASILGGRANGGTPPVA